MTLGILVNWVAGGAARLHDLLLRRDLHDVAEALDRAEHRDRRRGRRACRRWSAWAAATGSLSVEPLLLFLIIFFWTPPHFWALALFRSDDYARAGVPMLPVVAGPDATRLQILLYTHRAGRGGASRRGRSAISTRSTAWCRSSSAPACCGLRSTSIAAARAARPKRATRAAVRLLDPLSVRAVCDSAARGRRRAPLHR